MERTHTEIGYEDIVALEQRARALRAQVVREAFAAWGQSLRSALTFGHGRAA